jgi:predicted metalloprotease
MQWEGREQSTNVEDIRGFKPVGMALGGGSIIVLLVAMFLGIDPQQLGGLVGGGGGGGGERGAMERVDRQATPEEERQVEFSKTILRDTEVVWTDLFNRMGRRYEAPIMVLYTNRVNSACGSADASVGPFYCPGDRKVYIDVSFYQDMERKLRAPGEFARAYVIAHEVGHHVQHLIGYSQRVHEVRRRGDAREANRASVRLELQADFLAGVWAHHGQKKFKFLEEGDVETAMTAAYQIGDDRLQRAARGTVQPDSFTHGTSKQRQHWFMEGFKTGDPTRMKVLFEIPYDQL